MSMNISRNGLVLTRQFEGVRLTAYEDSAGVLTIGYGHTGPDVYKGKTITQDQANALLVCDMQTAVSCVVASVRVPLNQNQFDALADFTFNAGSGNFKTSTLLEKLNAGDYAGASDELPKWDHAGGQIVPGLLKRRQAEQELFLKAA